MTTSQEFRDLEESMWRAETRFDPDYLERVLHPDFFEFGRSGRTWTRAQTKATESGEIDAVLPLPDFTVAELGADTVLVTYRSIVRHEELDYANRSSIWVRDRDAWRLRFHQGTAVHPG
jgi:hypothetical protein